MSQSAGGALPGPALTSIVVGNNGPNSSSVLGIGNVGKWTFSVIVGTLLSAVEWADYTR
jgi:hypothetical protein